MVNKPPKLILDPDVLMELPNGKEIETMVNQEYLNNILGIRKIIQKSQKESIKAYVKIMDLVVN